MNFKKGTAALALKFVLAVVVARGPAGVKAQSGAAGINPPPTGAVKGTILNADTRRPISRTVNVSAALDGRAVQSATADSNGRYSFTGLAPGAYTIEVREPDNRFPIGTRAVTVTADAELTADIPLWLYGVISGAVTDPDRDPVQGARVLLISEEYAYGKQAAYIEGQAPITNDRGEYTFTYNVRSGHSYYLLAIPPRDASDSSRISKPPDDPAGRTEILWASWYPAPPGPASSSGLVLLSGESRRVDLRLSRGASYCLSGRVLPKGLPAGTVIGIGPEEISGYSPLGGGMDRSVIDFGKPAADGSFSFCRLWPGDYRIRTVAPDGRNYGEDSAPSYGEAKATLGREDVRNVSVQYSPPVRVSGSIRWDPPVESPQPVRLRLIPWSRRALTDESFLHSSDADERGPFAIMLPPQTDYAMVVSPFNGYLKEVRLKSGSPLDDQRFHVEESSVELVLTMSAEQGKLTAAISDADGKPVYNVFACAVPRYGQTKGEIARGSSCAMADAVSGVASLQLAPGEYSVLAVPDTGGPQRVPNGFNPQLLDALLARRSHGTLVTIGPKATVRVDLKL